MPVLTQPGSDRSARGAVDQPAGPAEYVDADPALRRVALITVLAGIVLGAAALGWFVPWLERSLLTAQARGTLTFPLACYLFLGMIVLLSAPVIWFGAHMAGFGRRVVAGGQYPPAGARVIRRTPVLRGPAARLAGRGQQVLGVVMLLCGIALLLLAGWGLVVIAR